MQFLYNILENEPEYKKLLDSVNDRLLPLSASGLSQIHKALISAALLSHTNKKILLITYDEASASIMTDDLKSFGVNARQLPLRDYNLAKITGFSKEYEHTRLDTLSKVLDGDFGVLVCSVDSCLQYTLPPKVLDNCRRKISVGNSLSLKEFSEYLINSGYARSELTEGAGQFSVRGGIIDIFPSNSSLPLRIELWGDEIDNISYFDPLTQRRTERLDSLNIAPACELPVNSGKLIEVLKGLLKNSKKLTDNQRLNIQKDIDLLSGGINIATDCYLPLIFEKSATVFDYAKDCLTVVCESANISKRLKTMAIQQNEDIKNLLEQGILCQHTSKLWLTSEEFYHLCDSGVYLESFPSSTYHTTFKVLLNFDFKRTTAWGGDIKILLEDIGYTIEKHGLAVILAGEEKAAKILNEELNSKGIKSIFLKNAEAVGKKGVFVLPGGLSGGLEIPSLKFLLITHRHISAQRPKRKIPKNAKEIGSLDELSIGDYVVHSSHGIGIFDGINRITNSGITKDYIKIRYAGSDVLYVPVTQLDLVSKYIGTADTGGVRLNKLGSDAWQKTRKRVKSAVKNMAKQLTALYAKRMSTKGYAFSPDTDLQSGFESKFEYEETEDQLRSANEIKSDMQRAVPMDRLLCGDVGFGKTEVALRAAFKCISEGKQCVLMVPTTILAMQHYNTVLKRFGDIPVTVKLLNRFVSKSEQTKIVCGLKNGRVDMVIGTHRLISKDISFKNIGLVIIDEEQRFGVSQKERLKELYPFVDILTLSATPIPRTLNMAMSGLRDMSSIDEAPGDRYPVQTYVLEHNDGVLIDAINKELRRGGQVYYLHNNTETITRCASRLRQNLPQAKIGIAHGQMPEEELSDVWQKLIEREIDILVCTTIIETGVDVPNANTLIIENADRMGLSQLHQLRGRVGRSARRAYAYFCYNGNRVLSEVASKRLEAIREFTEFGSGFKIAMRDLEIRGAGSILGGEQHGNMEAVGYDMYLKLLSDAVNEEKGIKVQPSPECTVDLNISAHIPDSYIDSVPARLGIYKRIADIRNSEDMSDVIDELCDRFGEPPQAVMGLINVAMIRNKAAAAGIFEITSTPGSVHLHTTNLNPDVATKLSSAFGERFSVSAINKPAYIIKMSKEDTVYKLTQCLADIL
ncbi:MAG: transcription-repair coupling factor [Clostridia bacterium]|nr:transcription-repair coupling factor [Clostridia bacterium]